MEQPKPPSYQVKVVVYSRVVGYYSPVSQWNKGKQEEFRERKSYKITHKQGEILT